MANIRIGEIVLFLVIVLVCLVLPGYGRPKICMGDTCDQVVRSAPMFLDVLGAYCSDICYGKAKVAYNTTCNCDKIVTTPRPPCRTTYLQMAVCDWSTEDCKGNEYCDWRQNMSKNFLKEEKIGWACRCPLKETEMKDPCNWTQAEMTLCSVLKVHRLLYADFQCICDRNPPKPPPETVNVCEYSKHRAAQLKPKRRKRLFAGNTAYNCNYPGVVGLVSHLGDTWQSVCTASLLSRDTILIDKQCRTVLKPPVYALVDSYDIRMVKRRNVTVDLDTISRVDTYSAVNTLYTAKLHHKVVLDNACVQPACLPNARTPAHHIDLNDCRVLGYGDTSDELITGPRAQKLQEIKVKVVPTSVTSDILDVTRNDGLRNTACVNEFSAPVVCAHKHTKEWITVGVHQNIGIICSGKSHPDTFQIANLLSEAMGNRYYKHLKDYQPKLETAIPK